MPVPQFLNTW